MEKVVREVEQALVENDAYIKQQELHLEKEVAERKLLQNEVTKLRKENASKNIQTVVLKYLCGFLLFLVIGLILL